MKTYKHLFTLAMAGLLAVSCQEDTAINTTVRPAEVGDPVLFGASAEYENANPGQTRTEYSGEVVDGKEIIWWVPETDKVQIYCAEASVSGFTGDEAHTSHYTVMGSKSNGAGHANWLQKQGEASLSWGGQNQHTFYGIYPSKTMFLSGDAESALTEEELSSFNFSGTTAYGYVHSEQIPASVVDTVDNGVTSYVAKADMRYAYMVAKTTTTREAAYTVDEVTGQVNGVSMNFIPLATALEMTLHLPTSNEADTEADVKDVTIARVSIKGTGVAGSFSADLNEWDGSSAYDKDKVNSGSISRDEIVIRINAKDANGNEGPVTLKAGGSLTFTVFLKPGANLSTLQIGFASDLLGQNTQYKSLESAGIVALKKNVISNLRLPVNFTNKTVDYAHWMEQMYDDTPISGISLPGTANSFSAGASSNNYKTQNLSFDDQWTAGIRAFEIVTDRANNTSGTGFSTLVLQCGKQDVAGNPTVSATVNNILAKLAANPYETAMLIFTYQPEGSNPKRVGAQYMQQLMTYVNTLDATKLVQFSPKLTLGTYNDDQYEKDDEGNFIKDENGNRILIDKPVSTGARGKLMIVVRPNQLDEKDYETNAPSNGILGFGVTASSNNNQLIWEAILKQVTGTNAGKILVVNGCGTGKDKWGARGYTIDGNRAYDISNSFSGNSIMETHMEQTSQTQSDIVPLYLTEGTEYTTVPGRDVAATLYRVPQYDGTNLSTQATNLKFGYQTNNNGITCWFQEWQRVVGVHITDSYSSWGTTYYRSRWFESYQEKLSNVKATFDMAISGDYSNYVFINSLDAYLVTNDSDDDSKEYSTGITYGGDYGDYATFSTKMNAEFYTYVNQRIKEAKAPTGIVLMNFVSDDPADGGAYYLPQLILSNNEFKAGIDKPNTGGGDNLGGGGNTEGGGSTDWE
ncbi:MAG: hypothetical protein IJC23_07405 [Bacteroidaceae bacterium]|nr:hypothetical protein [Bacteroidaceae bacterium]